MHLGRKSRQDLSVHTHMPLSGCVGDSRGDGSTSRHSFLLSFPVWGGPCPLAYVAELSLPSQDKTTTIFDPQTDGNLLDIEPEGPQGNVLMSRF